MPICTVFLSALPLIISRRHTETTHGALDTAPGPIGAPEAELKTTELAGGDFNVQLIADSPYLLQGNVQRPGQFMRFFAGQPIVHRCGPDRFNNILLSHVPSLFQPVPYYTIPEPSCKQYRYPSCEFTGKSQVGQFHENPLSEQTSRPLMT
jgi:hypothetical protein